MNSKMFLIVLLSVLGLALTADDSFMIIGQDNSMAYAMGWWPRSEPKPRPQPGPAPQPSPIPSPVPEPSTLTLIGTGAAGVGSYLLLRRRNKN